jgi:hypothetical protein
MMLSKGVIDKEASNPWRDFLRVSQQLHARQIIGVLNDMVWKV